MITSPTAKYSRFTSSRVQLAGSTFRRPRNHSSWTYHIPSQRMIKVTTHLAARQEIGPEQIFDLEEYSSRLTRILKTNSAKAGRDLSRIFNVNQLCQAIKKDSVTELPAGTLAALPRLQAMVPALRNAAIFIVPRDSFWIREFPQSDQLNGCVIKFVDRFSNSRAVILIRAYDPIEQEFHQAFAPAYPSFADHANAIILHEGIHIGQRSMNSKLGKVIQEGYTTILERRMFRSIFNTKQAPDSAYVDFEKLVHTLIEHIGEQAICDTVYRFGDMTRLAETLDSRLDRIEAVVENREDVEWADYIPDILDGKFDKMNAAQLLHVIREKFRTD